MPEAREPSVAVWLGELLWPQDLPQADVIDLSQVTAMGVWVHHYLRSRPDQAVTGGSPAIHRQLARAGVPVVWSDHPQRPSSGGVGSGERAMLFGG